MNEKLSRANWLQKEIENLEHFLYTVVEFDEKSMGIASVTVLMSKTVDVKISILGSRFFGCGTHIQDIAVPDQIRNGLIEMSKVRLQELKNELSAILP